MPRAPFEFAKREFADDGNAVAPVKCNGTDIEDASDGCVGSKSDQVDGNAPEDGNPDGVDGCSGVPIDLGPDSGAWNKSVSRKCKDGTCERLLAW